RREERVVRRIDRQIRPDGLDIDASPLEPHVRMQLALLARPPPPALAGNDLDLSVAWRGRGATGRAIDGFRTEEERQRDSARGETECEVGAVHRPVSNVPTSPMSSRDATDEASNSIRSRCGRDAANRPHSTNFACSS